MTSMMTPTAASEAFWASAIDHDEPSFLSFDRCVDWLLGLYRETNDEDLRSLISDVVNDLRELGPIEGEFEDVVLGALASVEIAFEIKAGCGAALAS